MRSVSRVSEGESFAQQLRRLRLSYDLSRLGEHLTFCRVLKRICEIGVGSGVGSGVGGGVGGGDGVALSVGRGVRAAVGSLAI